MKNVIALVVVSAKIVVVNAHFAITVIVLAAVVVATSVIAVIYVILS